MRMRFDHVDENAAIRARDSLVERFTTWLSEHREHDAADPWDAQLMLDWKWGYADGDYGLWTRADVDEFLLEHLPRKLSASEEEARSVPASIGAFVHFLDDGGLLGAGSDPVEAVARRALAQQRAFLDAMVDPRNFGMAKRLFTAGGFDLDEVRDQAALDDAMAKFNELSFEERGRILGLEDDPFGSAPEPDLPALPVRAVPSRVELDSAAREVVLLRQVDALHAALGPTGIKLTKAGNPTLADGKRLVEEVGVSDVVDGIRSSAELSELVGVWQVAQVTGAAEVVGDRLRAVDGWVELSAVDRWRRIVDAALRVGAATVRFGARCPMPLQLADAADAAAFHFIAMLWMAGEPVPIEEFVGILDRATSMDPDTHRFGAISSNLRASICRDRVGDVFVTLAAAGVVDATAVAATITDAGAWVVGPVLADAGFGVLQASDLFSLSSDELLDLLVDRSDEVEEVVALWVGERDPRAVADELVAALVARPEPVRVLLGFAVLEQLGAAALDVVAAARDTAIGPQAWLFLAAAGVVDENDVPRDVVVQAGVDLFLATSDLGSPADVIESLVGQVGAEDQPRFLEDLADSDHPRTGELLELVGRHHPVKSVGKHARKLAHRWRSIHGVRN